MAVKITMVLYSVEEAKTEQARRTFTNGHSLCGLGWNLYELWDCAILEDKGWTAERARIAKAKAEEKYVSTYCPECERHRCRCGKEGR